MATSLLRCSLRVWLRCGVKHSATTVRAGSWRKVARVWQGDSKYSAAAALNASHVAVAFERGSHSPHTPAGSASMYSLLSLGVVDLGPGQ